MLNSIFRWYRASNNNTTWQSAGVALRYVAPPRQRSVLISHCLIAHLTDEELEADVRMFAQYCLAVDPEQLLRAARIAKDVRLYNMIAHSSDPNAGRDLPVQLTEEEKKALCREKDSPLSEKGMWRVILTVSLAAFLQGASIPVDFRQ